MVAFNQWSVPSAKLQSIVPPRSLPQDPARLPDNPALEALPAALAAAVGAQGAPGGCVVMVVQPGERNAYDQQVSVFVFRSRGLILCLCLGSSLVSGICSPKAPSNCRN